MNSMNYLEMLPLNSIAKYAKGQPQDGVPFKGYPRTHPTDKSKLILVCDPIGNEPVILEFRLEDILFVEEVHSVVTEAGEGVPLVKLWVQRGAVGMILEPFEVSDAVQTDGKLSQTATSRVRTIKERILQNRPQANA